MGGAGLVGIIFLVVGGALLAVYAVGAAGTRRFLRTAVDVQGVVVDLQRYTSSTDGTTTHSWHPVVRFELPDGRPVQFEDPLGTSWGPYPVGEIVPVKYDPANPQDARLATSSFRLGGGTAVFALFGGAFAAIGLVSIVVGLL